VVLGVDGVAEFNVLHSRKHDHDAPAGQRLVQRLRLAIVAAPPFRSSIHIFRARNRSPAPDADP
jgi:hypothetical protein